MNYLDPKPARREAVVRYLDAEFQVLREGDFVLCAATGAAIALADLRYWNVPRQQPYGSAEAACGQRLTDRA